MDKVLRASKAGFPCRRNLWYSVNGFEPVNSVKTQRIFDIGTALEPVIVQWLINDGWEVDYNPGSQNAELELTIPLRNGSLAGHPDCIISKGNIKNALVDIKTMNERAFTRWKREGSLRTKPQYVTQLHIYAMGLQRLGKNIERLGIVGVNKNNSDLHIDFFDFDILKAADIENNAEWLFDETERPDKCPSETWACNYCEFAKQCELDDEPFYVPEPVQQEAIHDDVPVTHDETVINAMRALQEARALSKQARDLEAVAKAELQAGIRDKGLSAVQGGGLVCSINEKVSSRFDTAGFKKAHPDLADEFTKQASSTVYDITEAC